MFNRLTRSYIKFPFCAALAAERYLRQNLSNTKSFDDAMTYLQQKLDVVVIGAADQAPLPLPEQNNK